MTNLPDFLYEDECYIYCSKENSYELKNVEGFIPLDYYLENAEVRRLYYNVVGYIGFKQVIIKE